MRVSSAFLRLALALGVAAGSARAASLPGFGVVTQLNGQVAIGAVSGSTLYGTLTYGGTGNGTLFSLTTAGVYASLHDFVPATDGSYPNATLALGAGGSVWGTAPSNGPYGGGTLFSFNATGFHVPHAFGNGGDGASPLQGPIADSHGNIYGTNSGGAIATNGNFFMFEAAGKYLDLHDFLSGADGHCPFSGVARSPTSAVFGTTVGRGFGGNPNGSVWKSAGSTLTTIYVFSNGTDGEWPDQAPALDGQGNIYGTTHIQSGNTYSGAIWKIRTSGAFSVLHVLAGNDGIAPSSPLVLNTDGYFYGTTAGGGANGYGTVFRISTAGVFQVVHTFAGGTDGEYPTGSLVHDGAGAIYGGTQTGTVFRIGN